MLQKNTRERESFDKTMIDEWYSIPANMERLMTYTKKALKKWNKKEEDSCELISNAYLYVLSQDIDLNKGNVESLSKGYIKGEIFRSNSSFNRARRRYQLFEDPEDVYLKDDIYFEDTIYYIDDLLNEFVMTLTLHEKGIWNIFYTKRMNNCRLIMSYMNLSMNGSSIILNEGKALELRLREFIKIKIKDED